MPGQVNISENSRRVAKNTLLLYFRMFLLMVVGLYTSRVVLRNLGISDYGVYSAVGSLVMTFTVVSTSISSAVSRYMANGLVSESPERQHRIFSTSMAIQIMLAIVIIVLVETVGMWFLSCKMDIPAGRETAALWVMQASVGVLLCNLLSIPYNAAIIAHEKMGAFAYISIVEAMLKLGVALLLTLYDGDRLIFYALMLFLVSVLVRSIYSVYSRRVFQEVSGGFVFDRSLMREMTGFAGWNFLGMTSYLFNTQGINLLCNIVFGVTVNAGRLLATQIEGIVRQFVTNFLTALNPQIMKSYAAGNNSYTNELVCKGGRFSLLVIVLLSMPFMFEADILLDLWQGVDRVPEMTPVFVRLTLLCLAADLVANPLVTLVQATGQVRNYYIITGLFTFAVFVLSWVAFRLGAPAWASYVIFAVIYTLAIGLKLYLVNTQTGFPVGQYCREVLWKGFCVIMPSAVLTAAVFYIVPAGLARLLSVLVMSTVSVCASSWLFALTPGEKGFFADKLKSISGR